MWKGVSPEGTIAAHDIPAKPLDAYSYYNGDFIALEKAHLNKGWKLVDNWHPDNKGRQAGRLCRVPMLEATRPGDRLTLDSGESDRYFLRQRTFCRNLGI